MEHVLHARCIRCGHLTKNPPADLTVCPVCGGLHEIEYDYDAIRRTTTRESLDRSCDRTMWRFRALLPVKKDSKPTPLRVGGTPVYEEPRLAQELGVRRLFVKDDGQNPTASLKDRASAMAVVKAIEGGYRTVACSSTGNAASSLAGNAAAAGLQAFIFTPARAPKGKVAQLLIFGAHVTSVQGSYEDTFNLSKLAIEKWGWYNRNAAINPYLMEGKKTVALELAQQLGWELPDWVAVSVGDGCTIAGVYKGFYDLYSLGFIERIPRLLSVQATGCCPINRSIKTGEAFAPMEENTLADSIAVGVPRNFDKAVHAVKASNGAAVEVTDEEILAAMRLLGRTCGIFGEPAGVAALAGLQKAVQLGIVQPHESAAHIVTGNGLKDVANGTKAAGEPISLPPDLDALIAAYRERGLLPE